MTPKEIEDNFCSKMRDWAEACQTPLDTDSAETSDWRKEFQDHWDFVLLAIGKSNLLYRLFYARESVRATPCPTHKGKWSGCFSEPPCECSSYGNVTGWLPEKGHQRDLDPLSGSKEKLPAKDVPPATASLPTIERFAPPSQQRR